MRARRRAAVFALSALAFPWITGAAVQIHARDHHDHPVTTAPAVVHGHWHGGETPPHDHLVFEVTPAPASSQGRLGPADPPATTDVDSPTAFAASRGVSVTTATGPGPPRPAAATILRI